MPLNPPTPITRGARRRRDALRALTATTAAIAVSAALVACQAGDDRTRLSFFSWDNEEVMTPLVDAFEEANPDIEIEFSSAPPVAEYVSTLQTRLLSGTAADVFVMAAENKTNLIEGGYVTDLTGSDAIDGLAQFNLDAYSSDGAVYAASIASWGGGILYNTELTSQVGMTEPPQTWDEFLRVARDLQDAGITPFLETAQEIPFVLSAMLGSSFAATPEDEDAMIFAGETTFQETWTPAVEQWYELFSEGLAGSEAIGVNRDQAVAEFAAGRVAFTVTGPWSVPGIRESAPDLDFGYMPVPGATPEDAFFAGAASPAYAINAATEQPEAAERFLEFLTSDEAVQLYNEVTASITTTDGVQPVVDPVLEPVIEGVRDGRIYLASVAWPLYQDALTTEAVARVQQLIQGQITPAEFTATLDTKLEELRG